MVELLTFIGKLNLGTFIVLWTSTIILIILVSLLLFYIGQMNREAIKISNRLKILIAELSDKDVKLDNDDI